MCQSYVHLIERNIMARMRALSKRKAQGIAPHLRTCILRANEI